jgi:hypothetical protein
MNAKKIATSIPGEQYRDLERVRRRLKLKRSEAVQHALKLWLAAQEPDARVEQYVRAYQSHPEDAEGTDSYVAAWSNGLAEEDWGP